jgi:response regulator RpfG family c-di-GMP phosphodiesterase
MRSGVASKASQPSGSREAVILLVDDQPMIHKVVGGILGSRPEWSLHACATASEAIPMAERLKPDVVLLDVMLPDGSGMDLLPRLASHPDLPGTQVVMLSSDDLPEHKAAAFEAGAFDYMVKMPAAAEFLVRVQHAVRQSEMMQIQVRLLDQAESASREAAMQLRFREEAERLLHEKSEELDRLNRQLQSDHAVRLEALDRIGQDLKGLDDTDTLLRRLLSEARAMFSCEAGTIFLVQDAALVFAYAQNDVLNVETRFPDHRRSPVRLPVDHTSIAGAAAVAESGLVSVRDAYDLPADAPFRFNRSFDESTGFRTRAVLALALRTARGRLLGVLQLINPRSQGAHHATEFTDEDRKIAKHFAGIASVALERSEFREATLKRVLRVMEMADPKETGAHVNRVAEVASLLYRHWAAAHGRTPQQVESDLNLLRPAAKMHDIGKIAVVEIIKKPGKLSDTERAIMQTHTVRGAESLVGSAMTPEDEAIRDITLYHHARWDGTGYPDRAGLVEALKAFSIPPDRVPEPRGQDIPLFARLVALADVFDALMSARSYKEAWTPARVRAQIEKDAGTHFDPELAAIFLKNFDAVCAAHDMFDE